MVSVHTDVPDKTLTVARVIYSEASPVCSQFERFMVASVIWNRIGHPGFGRLKTAFEVVTSPGQFACINDKRNINWERSGRFVSDMSVESEDEYSLWVQCIDLADGNFNPFDSVVYYHDKSIIMPSSWNNKWWTVSLGKTTEHFMFYSVDSRV